MGGQKPVEESQEEKLNRIFRPSLALPTKESAIVDRDIASSPVEEKKLAAISKFTVDGVLRPRSKGHHNHVYHGTDELGNEVVIKEILNSKKLT